MLGSLEAFGNPVGLLRGMGQVRTKMLLPGGICPLCCLLWGLYIRGLHSFFACLVCGLGGSAVVRVWKLCPLFGCQHNFPPDRFRTELLLYMYIDLLSVYL